MALFVTEVAEPAIEEIFVMTRATSTLVPRRAGSHARFGWNAFLLLSIGILMSMMVLYGLRGFPLLFWEFVFAMGAVIVLWDMGVVGNQLGLRVLMVMLVVIAITAPLVLQDLAELGYFEFFIVLAVLFVAVRIRASRSNSSRPR